VSENLLRQTARSRWALVVVAAALGVGAVAVVYVFERAALDAASGRVAFDMRPSTVWRRVEAAGVRTPPTVAAGEAELADDEEIVGVEVSGQSRAYRLAALRDPQRHVVNDLVAGVPVSVAYCDLTECVTAYTRPGGSAPLSLAVAGTRDGALVVKAEGAYYDQRTGRLVEGPATAAEVPYPSMPCTRTTWGEWRRQHPDTRVYQDPTAEPAR
jgi:hypothetical protein